MQIKTESAFVPAHQKLYQDILNLTLSIQESYPNYSSWYKNTFLEGLKQKERKILVAIEQGEVVGCALLKKTLQEKKLCTLFVRPENRHQGLGQALLAQVVKELGQNPLVSVSEKNLAGVHSLFKRFGFHISAQKQGVYLPDTMEYYFNDERADAIQNSLIPVLMQRAKKLQKS